MRLAVLTQPQGEELWLNLDEISMFKRAKADGTWIAMHNGDDVVVQEAPYVLVSLLGPDRVVRQDGKR